MDPRNFEHVHQMSWKLLTYTIKVMSTRSLRIKCQVSNRINTNLEFLFMKGDAKFEIFTSSKSAYPTVFEIDSWNFQQILDLGFAETSQPQLKFCEVSENPKSSICWRFQLSISKTVGCPHFWDVNISNLAFTLSRFMESQNISC